MAFGDKARGLLVRARDWAAKPEPFECRAFHENPADRNLLVFVDGTNNDPSARDKGKQTNVYRMSRLVDESEGLPVPQRAIYHAGVGSETDDPNYVSAVIRQLGGRGVDRILDETYLMVVNEYHPGDRLFILGFSRGATLARMLANRLAEDGIPHRGVARYHHYSKAASVKGARFKLLDRVEPEPEGEAPIPIRRIEALGLWDSVVSVGPLERLFERAPNVKIPDCVHKTYHLVSIDENRIGFAPSLIEPDDRVEEIWFPGVHSDVGGGYREAGLANIALRFMMQRLREDHGVRFKPVPKCGKCEQRQHGQECDHPECHRPNCNATLHRHPMLWPRRTRRVRALNGLPPRIHYSAFERLNSEHAKPLYRPRELLRHQRNSSYVLEQRD